MHIINMVFNNHDCAAVQQGIKIALFFFNPLSAALTFTVYIAQSPILVLVHSIQRMETQRHTKSLRQDHKASAEMTKVRMLVGRLKISEKSMKSTLARFDNESSGTIAMDFFDKAVAKLFSRARPREIPDWDAVKRHYKTDGAVSLSVTMEVKFRYRPFILECYREEDSDDESRAPHSKQNQTSKFKVGSNVEGRSNMLYTYITL